MSRGVIGVTLECQAIVLNRFVGPAQPAKGAAQTIMSRSLVRLRPQRGFVVLDCISELPLAHQGVAQVVEGADMIGLLLQHQPIFRESFVELLQAFQCFADIIVSLKEARLCLQRSLEIGDRLRILLLGHQRDADIIQGLRVPGLYGDRLAIIGQGFIQMPLLVQEPAKIVTSKPIVSGHGKVMAIESFTVPPIAELVASLHRASDQHQPGGARARHLWQPPPVAGLARPPNQNDEQADQWQVGVAVGHGLFADLDQANDRHQHSEKPEPAGPHKPELAAQPGCPQS